MSQLIVKMRSDLQAYKALEHHQSGYAYYQELNQLQQWQARRLRKSHASLLHEPNYRSATEFILDEVYGGIDLYDIALDIDRALPVAMRLFSDKVMETAAMALELNLLTAQLDLEMMKAHFIEFGFAEISEESYLEAYRLCDHFTVRKTQIELAQNLSLAIDQYIASKMIYMGFKMAKGPAYAAGLQALYGFMRKGFDVLRPLGGAQHFVARITQPELHFIERIKSRQQNPFKWQETEVAHF